MKIYITNIVNMKYRRKLKNLDKVIDIMERDPLLVIEISSHTDARATAETNMKRSKHQ